MLAFYCIVTQYLQQLSARIWDIQIILQMKHSPQKVHTLNTANIIENLFLIIQSISFKTCHKYFMSRILSCVSSAKFIPIMKSSFFSFLQEKEFLERLESFSLERGVTLPKQPIWRGKRISFFRFYNLVLKHGGFENVS